VGRREPSPAHGKFYRAASAEAAGTAPHHPFSSVGAASRALFARRGACVLRVERARGRCCPRAGAAREAGMEEKGWRGGRFAKGMSMVPEHGDEGKCAVEPSASSGEGQVSHAAAEVGSALVARIALALRIEALPRTACGNLARRGRRWVRGKASSRAGPPELCARSGV
jgi:hypothetical protein